MNPEPKEHWALDKRIPLALILAIGIQTAGAIWWAATINSRVGVLEERLDAMTDQRDRIIRVETILERIETKLDRIAP